MRPVPTARAPSGAEGAGPIAEGGLVTAKADEYLVEWSRLPRSDKVFLLDRPRPVFFFEKENGGAERPGGWASSSAQAAHPSLRRKRQSSLAALCLLSPPDPLRWAPAGAPLYRHGWQ